MTCQYTTDKHAPYSLLFIRRHAAHDYVCWQTGEIIERPSDLECDYIAASESTFELPARGQAFDATYMRYNAGHTSELDKFEYVPNAIVNL